VHGTGSFDLVQVPGVCLGIAREHVVARQEAVDDKGRLENGRHLGRHELRRLSAGYVSVRFNLYAAGEEIARVRLDLVTLVGEVLLVVGQDELIEELGFVELEPKVLRAKEKVRKRRF
jgi:hypothetical protein